MEKIRKNFLLKKKLLMELNSDDLNKDILYFINEARNSPKQFSHHLVYIDNNDNYIKNLSLFFKNSSIEVQPLFLDKNLSKCSQDLLAHIITLDDGRTPFKYNREEKMRNSLKERLKKLNLIPIHYNNFIIIGTENSFDAIINLFLNEDYRNKILSPEMNLIGIASGLLPSENLCIIIDVVHSIKIYDFSPVKYNFVNTRYGYLNNTNKFGRYSYYNDNNRKILKQNFNTNNINNKSEQKIFNMKQIFKPVITSPCINKKNENNCFSINKKLIRENNDIEDNGINLKIVGQKTPNLKKGRNLFLETPKYYKIPISVCIDKQYIKNKHGKLVPIYTRETTYDDGSILLQPDI